MPCLGSSWQPSFLGPLFPVPPHALFIGRRETRPLRGLRELVEFVRGDLRRHIRDERFAGPKRRIFCNGTDGIFGRGFG